MRVDAPGQKRFSVRLTNDTYDPETNADRNLLVDWMEVRAPARCQRRNRSHTS
ncbi:hypothetical protein JJE73_12600 [Comamonas sp. JC664]|nr:hypothetical protein [Comamonas sp. JC664]GHG77686.1 hypothetical protein GCM10012319_27950 [Comamonas sp. KCTC 72670]